jgi:hypothetical protein
LLLVVPVLLLLLSTIASLSIWAKTSGTWINTFTVLFGTAIGLLLQDTLPLQVQRIITQGLGLFTVFLGLTMANSLINPGSATIDGVLIGLLAIVVGGILGELLHLEDHLQQLGERLKRWFKGSGRFSEGFVAASLLFCVGPMTIVGCLNNGLSGDHRLLTIKAIMDGLAAMAFSSIYGIGVGFAAGVILLYQGSLSLAAGGLAQILADPAHNPQVLLLSGVGGLMVLGIGCNLLEITHVRVTAFLPALVLAPVFWAIAQALA